MMDNWSTAGRIFHLTIATIFTIVLISLAFVWSLGQTIEFTRFIFVGEENWGTVMGIAIQLGPQIFLALASYVTGNQRIMWFSLFWLFSAIDAGTNIGARLDNMSFDTLRLGLATSMGIVLDICVVFFEELIAYTLGVVFEDVAKLIEDFGGSPPPWLRVSSRMAHRMGTGSRKNRSSSNALHHSEAPDNIEVPFPLGQPKRERRKSRPS